MRFLISVSASGCRHVTSAIRAGMSIAMGVRHFATTRKGNLVWEQVKVNESSSYLNKSPQQAKSTS